MGKLSRIFLDIFIFLAVSVSANAETAGKGGTADADVMQNTGTYIDVIKYTGGEREVIYSGFQDGYNNGIFTGVDFDEINFMVVFDWDNSAEEAYIVPRSESDSMSAGNINAGIYAEDSEVMQITEPDGTGRIITNMMLVYNNKYHENVLLPNETLTVPVTVTNTGSVSKNIVSYIAQYNMNGTLIGLKQGNIITVPANQTVTGNISEDFSVGALSTAKVFLWEAETMSPVHSDISMQIQAQDYYADNFDDAENAGLDKSLCGVINTAEDIDIVKIVPETSGVYAVGLTGSQGMTAGLYDASRQLLKAVSDSDKYLLYNLVAGQNYYLRFSGSENSAYTIKPTQPEEVDSVLKNIGQSKAIEDISDYDVFTFIPEADGEYIITAVDADHVKADLYNSEFNMISSSQTSEEDVSFRITANMRTGMTYYIIVSSKPEQQTGSYTLYVEEPFSVISLQQ